MWDNPWTYIVLSVAGAMALILGCSALIGATVGAAARSFAGKTAERTTQGIAKHLPGTDCGECGCENCKAFAGRLLYGDPLEACCHLSEEQRQGVKTCLADFHKLLEDPTPPKKRKQTKGKTEDLTSTK